MTERRKYLDMLLPRKAAVMLYQQGATTCALLRLRGCVNPSPATIEVDRAAVLRMPHELEASFAALAAELASEQEQGA